MIKPTDYVSKVAKISRIKKSSENRLLTLFAQEIEEFRTGVSAKSNSDE